MVIYVCAAVIAVKRKGLFNVTGGIEGIGFNLRIAHIMKYLYRCQRPGAISQKISYRIAAILFTRIEQHGEHRQT